jgi:hypothetical protein
MFFSCWAGVVESGDVLSGIAIEEMLETGSAALDADRSQPAIGRVNAKSIA